jgi:hypothetical protein
LLVLDPPILNDRRDLLREALGEHDRDREGEAKGQANAASLL